MADPHDLHGIPADPVRFQEAIDALRDKVPMTQELFDELTAAQQDFAFTVANVTQADLVAEVLEAMETAVRDGTSFEEFQAGPTADRLSEAWGGENPPRLEMTFRTSLMCILPSQLFSGRPLVASKARYAGEILQLLTESGRHLALTPNHPVLTDRGFVAANQLRHGDYLISYGDGVDHLSHAAKEAEQQAPAPVEDVFRSLAREGACRVSRALGPLDLHGDARCFNGKVDIVGADGELLDDIDAARANDRRNLVLKGAAKEPASLYRDCARSLLIRRQGPMTGRLKASIERLGARVSLGFGHRQPFGGLRLRRIPKANAGPAQMIANLLHGKAEITGNAISRSAFLVERGRRIKKFLWKLRSKARGFGSAAHMDTRKPNATSDDGGAYSTFLRELRDRSAGSIARDKLIEVGNLSFNSHVFDFQTTTGWYSAGGLIVSNCAYNEGRYRQMTAPAVAEVRTYWRYDAIEDDTLRKCPICHPCRGVILPADHAWWQKHYPILHPSCRCIATPLTEDEAKGEGITRSPPASTPAAGFGEAPSVTGSDWAPSPDDYPAPVAAVLEDRLDETG